MGELKVEDLKKKLRPQLRVVRETNGHVPDISRKSALEGLILPKRGTDLLLRGPQNGEDRSARLFELGALLLEHGATPEETFVLLQASGWNKFKGRSDEVERLWEAVDRAVDKRDSELGFESHNGKASLRRGVRNGQVLRRLQSNRVDRLLARDLPQSEWCVERIWEHRGWGFVAGEPKTYKSTFTTDLGISIATGTPFLGHFEVSKPGPVLIVQEENSENIQWARFSRILRHKDLGGKLHSFDTTRGLMEVTFPSSECEVYCIDRSRFSFTNKRKKKALEADIKALQPRMVILDPLQRMMGDLSIRSEQDVTQVLDWLDYVVSTYHCGIMLVHHYHKRREESAVEGGQRMLGSQALHAWLSCGLYVSRQAGGRLKVSREFRAFAGGGPFELEFQSHDDEDFYHVEVFESQPKALRESQDDLLDLIQEQPGNTATDYAESLGVSRRTVSERLDRLVEKGYIEKKARKTPGKGRPQVVYVPRQK